MKMNVMLPTALLAIGMAIPSATAAPLSSAPNLAAETAIEKAQAFHRDCRLVDNKWTYRKGDKALVCRPHRPEGSGWSWRREGPRVGWYHAGRKNWHGYN